MELNPYQAPVVATPTLADEQHAADRPAPRPAGIWVLSGLHLLVGLLLVASTVFLAWRMVTEGQIRSFLPFWLVLSLCGCVSALSLASGIGLWLGKRWGWWLTAFYYVWGALGAVAQLLFVLWRVEFDPELIVLMLPGNLVRFAVHALIVLYLFKGTVRSFFRLKSLRMATALTLLAAVAFIVLAATIGMSYSQSIAES